MSTSFDLYRRLETRSNDRDLQRGFAADVLDPVWFLARQWQMGEHQGENATTPVLATYTFERTPIEAPAGVALDPARVPTEMIIESEIDDWWTMGRRLRLGRRVAGQLGWLNGAAPAGLPGDARYYHPPPPYERFHGAFDGRVLWRHRGQHGITAAMFGAAAEQPPPDTPFTWRSDRFHYRETFPNAERPLLVDRHRGGAIDWYSGDGDPSAKLSPPGETVASTLPVVPTPLEYPGAPHSRWWEIEDGAVDIGGYPPDSAHFATMLLVELIYSHGDDWFLFPVTAPAGHIVTIASLEVRDAFDRTYASTEPKWTGLRSPEDWSVFATVGLRPASLALWTLAELPLEGPVIERVQFGIDEQSNLLWAVERVVDSRDVGERRPLLDDAGGAPPFPEPAPSGDLTREKVYQYVPGRGVTLHWHPYLLDESQSGRLFIQGGLTDLSRQEPRPLPPPEAEVLQGGTPDQRALHRIVPAAVPSQGIELERRAMLTRDAAGNPVLWTQRQRKPLRTPPGRTLRFDLLEETVIPS
jgi:hypothetical protein